MQSLSDFDIAGLESLLREWGCKPSHAAKVLAAYYDSAGVIDLASLELGRELRDRLQSQIATMGTTIAGEHVSADGTVKFLVGLADGAAVEAVLMPAFRAERAAGCISSQVGCAMGCEFCASARGGLVRNLSAAEIVEQFLHLKARARSLGRRLTSLVFMGMGEPLHNLPNVLAAIERIADERMGRLGRRHIAVSTVGIVPGMDALAEAERPVCLALSLHAADDATRCRIVPANRRWGVAQVMDAARRFQAKTGHIVNIEYCLLAGINDSDEQAQSLAQLMRGFRAHVNLIPHNWIGSGLSGVEYRKPAAECVERFAGILRGGDVVTHVRVPRGDDVSAACGQLSQRKANGNSILVR